MWRENKEKDSGWPWKASGSTEKDQAANATEVLATSVATSIAHATNYYLGFIALTIFFFFILFLSHCTAHQHHLWQQLDVVSFCHKL